MNTLTRYSALKDILVSLEDDLGLSEFNQAERRIIAALSNPAITSDGLSVNDLLTSSLLNNTTQSSLYRALRHLKKRDYIEVVGDRKTGNYRMVES